jgi:hypothetical protein
MLATILGMAALTCSCFLIRSMMVSGVETALGYGGNYDLAFWNVKSEFESLIYADERIADISRVFFCGEATIGDDTYTIGAFENEKAVDMFHLPMIMGKMPTYTGEIAVDRKTLNSIGYAAVTGQTIELNINGIVKEFIIVGVFEQIFNIGYGDMYMRQSGSQGSNAVFAPLFYISVQDADIKSTGIMLLNAPNTDGFYDYDMAVELYGLLDTIPGGARLDNSLYNRSNIARGILGTQFAGNITGTKQTEEFLNTNQIEKDFYSGVLIPVLSVLIIIVSIFSLYSAYNAVLSKRAEKMRLYRCIGMTKKHSVIIFSVEFLLIGIVAAFIGFLVGCGLYILIVECQKAFLGISPLYAFNLEGYFAKYIAAATNSPYTFPVTIIAVCVLAVAIIYAVKITRISLITGDAANQKLIKRQTKTNSAVRLLIKRTERKNRIMNLCMLAVVSTIMVSSTFGYLYLDEENKYRSMHLLHALEQAGLGGADYTASVYINNLLHERDTIYHEAGISTEILEELENDANVNRVEAVAKNLSTRLVYQSEVEALKAGDIRYYASKNAPDADWEVFFEDIYRRKFANLGFPEDAGLYSAPTVAINDVIMSRLGEFLIEGEINIEKLNSGEEVLLVFPSESELLDSFEVGQILPLADVIYPEETDSFKSLAIGAIPDWAEPSYYEEFEGEEYAIYLYGGQRLDINTKSAGS